ncbi:40S ribosomal protein S9-1 [Tanacetum coccineum]
MANDIYDTRCVKLELMVEIVLNMVMLMDADCCHVSDGKIFKKSRRPYENERLDAELKLVGEYSLRRKRGALEGALCSYPVGRQVVNVPPFMGKVDSQKHIDFSLTRPFRSGRPGRVKRKNHKADTKKAAGGDADEE